MTRYIGLDVHSQSTALAIVGESGRKLGSKVLETSAPVLIEALRAIPGPRRLVLEEGTQSSWLAEVLGPHVEKLVVTVPRARTGEAKSDVADAFARAEELRRGALDKTVFKSAATPLRQALKLYQPLTTDMVRAKNRFRALLRSRGLQVNAEDPYDPTPKKLERMLKQLPTGMRFAAEATLEQIMLLEDLRNRAEDVLVGEASKHPAFGKLLTAPGFGPIRVATVLAIVVIPDRFRQSHQFWSYCGLGVLTVVSSEFRFRGGLPVRQRQPMTRGLKPGNPMLKNVFKGAALTVALRLLNHPMHAHYRQLLKRGMGESLARVTIARKLAAIVLAMWKNMEAYDPAKHHIHHP